MLQKESWGVMHFPLALGMGREYLLSMGSGVATSLGGCVPTETGKEARVLLSAQRVRFHHAGADGGMK
jgi:hypothetical protein